MKKIYWVVFLLSYAYCLDAQSYRKLHFSSSVIDTHNDILTTCLEKGYSFDNDLKGKTHSDLTRWAAGGVDVQVFSVWCDGTYGPGKAFAFANRQIDTLYATIQRHPGKIALTTTPAQMKANLRAGRLSAMIGVEGGHMIEENLSNLDSLYRRGVRYMTLTWNNSTSWATSAMLETTKKDSLKQKGLTTFGKEVVKRMNELGMIVDLSHVGEQTFWDAINTTTKPVIASHSCAYTLCPVFRNLNDEQIKAVGRNGGVIHINFFSGFVDSNFMRRNDAFIEKHKAERDSILKTVTDPYFADDYLYGKYASEVSALRPPLSMLIDHLDYIVKLIGVDHVGLGSDFDGVSSTPQQLDDVTTFPLITEELVKRGYSKKDIRKILGGNFIHVWKAQK
jgi:membrane dipeptidase